MAGLRSLCDLRTTPPSSSLITSSLKGISGTGNSWDNICLAFSLCMHGYKTWLIFSDLSKCALLCTLIAARQISGKYYTNNKMLHVHSPVHIQHGTRSSSPSLCSLQYLSGLGMLLQLLETLRECLDHASTAGTGRILILHHRWGLYYNYGLLFRYL